MSPITKHAVLLVDDEPEILFSLRGLLRREFDLYTAQSGAEALEILQQHRIHVIMTDQRMPVMTGVELLRRAHTACPEAIPIVFTGYADIKAVVDAINQGQVYRYLTKPWDPDDLLTVLLQACDQYDRMDAKKHLLLELRDHLNQCHQVLDGQSSAPAQAKQLAAAGSGLLERLNRVLEAEKETQNLERPNPA